MTELDRILYRLKKRLDRVSALLDTPFLYLDPEAVLHLFQSLTGLARPPLVRFFQTEPTDEPDNGPFLEAPAGLEPSTQAIFEAMAPLVEERTPLAAKMEDFDGLEHQYARVRGLMQSTRFPDGELNLEIGFSGLRGLLFYTSNYFSSAMRPLLAEDRFHTIYAEVEALVYVHGPVRRTIFYHLTYGDNREHDWLALTPVAVKHSQRQ